MGSVTVESVGRSGLGSASVRIRKRDRRKHLNVNEDVHKYARGYFSCACYYPARIPSQMASAQSSQLKDEVQDFWNAEPCGSRYLQGAEDFAAFEAHARSRHALEPHIPQFAKFSSARGLRVLEIGVGMGADYLEWLKAGANASGVDLSPISIARAKRRCVVAGYEPDLRVADAERLPFASDTFDVVYSYGVMHHSSHPAQCLAEAWRVLKPGGEARIMLYHHPSLTGLMLWLRYGVLRGKSLRRSVFDYLESPGTKTYTKAEVRALMEAFESPKIQQVFSPGDLLLNAPSARFRSAAYRLIWKCYPRMLVRKFGRRWGLFLLISGRKRARPTEICGKEPPQFLTIYLMPC
jgi:ubiquinone/menaquinone biosynthesis C-methylase UbiE